MNGFFPLLGFLGLLCFCVSEYKDMNINGFTFFLRFIVRVNLFYLVIMMFSSREMQVINALLRYYRLLIGILIK